jgi:GT2 family glycosyltransferase
MNRSSRPTLTIGVPLHASRKFIATVSNNIDAIDRDDVEILLSDRTGLDDALAILSARYRHDERVVSISAVDGVSWIEHCNALLRRARGTYFCWMPHDDDLSPGWCEELLCHLETDPNLLMAFGRIEPVDDAGVPWPAGTTPATGPIVEPPPPVSPGSWTVREAVAVLRWSAGIAFRGVFRREPVIAEGLFLPRTRDGVDADATWVFGMALLGPLCYVPEVTCRKRYDPASTHGQWEWRVAQRLSSMLVRAKYALRYPRSVRSKAEALAGVVGHQSRFVFAPVKQRVRRGITRTRAKSWRQHGA